MVAYVFFASVAWASISPPGGVPDEPSHIAYAAAVVRGQLSGDPIEIENNVLNGYDVGYEDLFPGLPIPVVAVPKWIVMEHRPCYAFNAFTTPECSPDLVDSGELVRIPTYYGGWPPLFYGLTGLPTLVLSGESGLYAMRYVAAALAAGLIALGLAISVSDRRLWLALGVMVAFTPMVAFLAGSVNPSGMEAAAALALGAGLLGIGKADRQDRATVLALLLALIFVLAWVRPRSILILVAVIAVGGMLNATELMTWVRRRCTRWVLFAGSATAIVTATAYDGIIRTSIERESALILVGSGGGVADLLVLTVRSLGRMTVNLVGVFGWLDHWPPTAVQISWILGAVGLFLLAVVVATWWETVTLAAVAFGALVLAPAAVAITMGNGGQARHHLSLAVLVPLVAVVIVGRHSSEGFGLKAMPALRVWALLAPMAMVLSVAGSLYRYSVGGEAGLFSGWSLAFAAENHWRPPVGALGVAVLGCVAAVGFGITIAWIAGREDPE